MRIKGKKSLLSKIKSFLSNYISDFLIITGIALIFLGLYLYSPRVACIGLGAILLFLGLVPYIVPLVMKPKPPRR